MKVTGKKSLGSFIKIVIQFVFIIGIILLITLPSVTNYLIKIWNLDMRGFKLPTALLFYITGTLVLKIIYNFIGLFDSLKQNNPFTMYTVERLKNSAILSIIIFSIYLLPIAYSAFIKNVMEMIFFFIIGGIFFVLAIALYILAELFKQAVQYKEENELTI